MADQELISFLEQFITPERLDRFNQILNNRISHMQVVLEDIYQAHNASAVLRSCDCFGVQEVNFIENKNNLRISEDVAMGSTQWLSINRFNKPNTNNTADCLDQLKARGYKIVATTPHTNDVILKDFNVGEPFALVFGTEITGLSQTAMEKADAFLRIPMYGFTESFNISVTVALCLYELTEKIRSQVSKFGYENKMRDEIYLKWLCNTLQKPEAYLREFEKRKGKL